MFCSECGKEVQTASRFCPACGTPTQGETTPPAPSAAPVGPLASVPAAETAALPGPVFGQRVRMFLPAGVGAAVLLIVVILLVKGLGGASGGAESPTAAVQQMARAAQVEDPAAAIAVIDPGEARTLGALYGKVRDDVRSSGAIQSNGAVAGTHVAIQNLQLSGEHLSSDVVKVTITGGTLGAALKAATLPLTLGVSGDSQSTTNLGSARGPGGAGLFLMTRKQEGRWYISPTLTVLQYIVELHGLPEPDFSTLDAPSEAGQSASSPEQLASELAQAVSGSNVSGVLGLASDREASAVRPYSAALQELIGRAGGSLQAQVSAPQFTETSLGSGLVRLDLTHAGINLSIDSGESNRTIDGTLNGPCVAASETTDSGTSGSNGCFARMRRLFGVDNFFVVAERTAGRLRLAPIATVLEYARLLVGQLGGAGVRRLLGVVTQEAPAGELTPGSRLSGHLNAAGYTVLTYRVAHPGLLAVDSNQDVAILNPDGQPLRPLACPDVSQLYQLAVAGTYRVVLAASDYQAGNYYMTVESVHASNASVPSHVSGSVGDGARIAVLAFDLPPTGVSFETQSSVQSTIAGPVGSDSNYCRSPDIQHMVGPNSLLHPPQVWTSIYPSFWTGSSYENASMGLGRHYLVISGAPGTRFNGSLSAHSQASEGG